MTVIHVYDIVRSYGHEWKTGVLAEHLHLVPETAVRTLASGDLVVVDERGFAYPVVCGELIEIPTEDGPITGRCGLRVKGDGYACPGHTVERESWRALSESEKAQWERRQEEVRS